MKIRVIRSGGLMGRRVEAQLDLTGMEGPASAAFREKLAQSGFFDLPGRLAGDAAERDRFQYEITVCDEGREHTVTGDESALPAGLVQLANEVLRSAAPKPGSPEGAC